MAILITNCTPFIIFLLFLSQYLHHKNPMNRADANTSTSADKGDIFNSRNTIITGYVPPSISGRTALEKPTGITEGWLEKKKSSKMFSVGPAWQKR